MENQKDKLLTCSRIVYIMVFFAFIVNVLIPASMSITILDMIQQPTENTTNNTESRFYSGNEIRFEWNELQKNTLLGCFFWGYLLEAYGGFLADTWGPKNVFGYGMVSAGLITMFTPLIARWHFYALVVSRILLGIVTSGTLTYILPLGSNWIPPTERSTFLSLMTGDSFGTAIALPLNGYLVWWFGWPSVFYFSGSMCIIFSCLWLYVIYDYPDRHPRISLEEKTHLNAVLQENWKTKNRRRKTVPWRRLLSSKPMWATVLAGAASGQIFYFMLSQLPNYMDAVHKVNIRSNGIFSSIPYIGHFCVSVICAIVADRMFRSAKFRTVTIRKLFATMTLFIPSVLLAFQTIYGDVKWACVLLFSLILFFKGGLASCVMSNVLDIAPNFGGTMIGISATIATMSTIILNELIGVLTRNNNTFEQWRFVLMYLMGINFSGYVFFMIFASGEVQSWNKIDEPVNEEEK